MRAQVCVFVNKLLTERSEEADANVNLLDAVAAMRDARTLPVLFMHDVDSLSLAFMLVGDGASNLLSAALTSALISQAARLRCIAMSLMRT